MRSPTLPARRGGGTERPFARCRRAAGLDLYRAATRLGCSAAYLRALELGNHALSQRLAFRIAREYGVRVNELFVSDDFLQPRQAVGAGKGVEGRVETPPTPVGRHMQRIVPAAGT